MPRMPLMRLAALAAGALPILFVLPADARNLDIAMQSVVSVLPEWPPDARRLEEPEGSGVVVLDGTTIVTALHVVDKALSVRIRTADGDIVSARLKGRDKATDIATLEIDAALRPLPLADGEPELGDRVCAIGNAFGLGLSVSCGVVSGKHRAGIGFNAVEDFVQTDAAVNPGASGGALVTEEGKFVGMLSAIFTKTSDANIGINFAVSADLATEIARQLHDKDRVMRPISGMRLEQVPAKGETGRLGARVVNIRADSLGARAGFSQGDVIVRAGGRRIRKPADFVGAMALLLSAEALEVEILRGGEAMTLQLRK